MKTSIIKREDGKKIGSIFAETGDTNKTLEKGIADLLDKGVKVMYIRNMDGARYATNHEGETDHQVLLKTIKDKQEVAVKFVYGTDPHLTVRINNKKDIPKMVKLINSVVKFRKQEDNIVRKTVGEVYDAIKYDLKEDINSDSLMDFFVKKHGGIKKIYTTATVKANTKWQVDKKTFELKPYFEDFLVFVDNEVVFNDGTTINTTNNNMLYVFRADDGHLSSRSIIDEENNFTLSTSYLEHASKILELFDTAVPVEELEEFVLKYVPRKFGFKVTPLKASEIFSLPEDNSYKHSRTLYFTPYQIAFRLQTNLSDEKNEMCEEMYQDMINHIISIRNLISERSAQLANSSSTVEL